MISYFDVIAYIFILLAMLLSKQPKKSIIAFCAICFVIMTGADWLASKGWADGWAFFYTAFIVEFVAVILLLFWARMLPVKSDRSFIYLMCIFFAMSYAIQFRRFIGWDHSDYVFVARLVSGLHILVMLVTIMIAG